jgi:serine/threonine-protein kinase
MTTEYKRVDSPQVQTSEGPRLAFVGTIGIRRIAATLAGAYTVLKQLPGTEAAEYYLARPTVNGDVPVRIKVLAPRAACDFRKRELFRLECGAASRLDHRSIARSSKAFEVGGIHLCTMEYRPWGETLRDLLQREGWLSVERAARIINQVASALDYAHRSGVVHLRLTPENILIEPNGKVLVADFGIGVDKEMAWAHHERSRNLAAPYRSIEQAGGASLDHRSDLYSLGVLLYEMLTDRVPFDSYCAKQLARRRATQMPLPPRVLSAGVPNRMSEIAMRLLEREPGKRFRRGAEVQEALSRAVDTTIQVSRDERMTGD